MKSTHDGVELRVHLGRMYTQEVPGYISSTAREEHPGGMKIMYSIQGHLINRCSGSWIT